MSLPSPGSRELGWGVGATIGRRAVLAAVPGEEPSPALPPQRHAPDPGGSTLEPQAQDPLPSQPGARRSEGSELRARGFRGTRAVAVAATAVTITAVVEGARTGEVGVWTGACLVIASVVAALVTRAGDRSLPAMMPPLAFLAGVVVAGLATGDLGGWSWSGAGLHVLTTLGANAAWVVSATAAAVVIAAVRHLLHR